jgi:hypothetical protein
VLIFGNVGEETIALMFGMTIPAIVLSVFAVNFGKAFTRGNSLGARIIAAVALAFAAFVSLSVASGFFIAFLMSDPEPALPIAIAGMVMANVVFFFLMGAPTPIGRKMMDGIAGLRQYLTLAEKDRMNMQGAPQMSPSHYETLLPYAVALGVEKPWSDAFQTWLVAAAAAGERRRPAMSRRPGIAAPICAPTRSAAGWARCRARWRRASPPRCRRPRVRPRAFRGADRRVVAAAAAAAAAGSGSGRLDHLRHHRDRA